MTYHIIQGWGNSKLRHCHCSTFQVLLPWVGQKCRRIDPETHSYLSMFSLCKWCRMWVQQVFSHKFGWLHAIISSQHTPLNTNPFVVQWHSTLLRPFWRLFVRNVSTCHSNLLGELHSIISVLIYIHIYIYIIIHIYICIYICLHIHISYMLTYGCKKNLTLLWSFESNKNMEDQAPFPTPNMDPQGTESSEATAARCLALPTPTPWFGSEWGPDILDF